MLPPWVLDFIKGHHFSEDWGIIEHFIPEGMRMKKLFCLTLSILDSQAAIQQHIEVWIMVSLTLNVIPT